MDDTTPLNGLSEDEKAQKIQSLRDMIDSAEKTIHGAKSMLLQIEGKKKAGRRRKVESGDDERVVEGTFDGQIMIGADGKQYPVPANYASKSKLVEGDHLKLNITPDGSFIYKQIGPAPRHNLIGIVSHDEDGNYIVISDNTKYKVLLASITYFKAEPGDEVVIVTAQEDGARWAAVENVLQRGAENPAPVAQKAAPVADADVPQTAHSILTGEPATQTATAASVIDEWTPNIDEIEKEIKQEMQSSDTQ